ncbi:MAG: MFS transporter, partial [Candidatus Cyclonatronum sp.]|nr:MFS transporter [Cyclonatronum sp.]
FSAEFLLFTVAQSLSTLAVSLLLEFNILELQTAILIFSAGLVLTGIIWLLTVARREKADVG